MSYYLYLLYLMCFCFFKTVYMDPVFNSNLDGYIERHTISTLKQILRTKRGFTTVDINQIGQINRTLENASANLFSAFNETYILLGNTISKIEISNKTLDLIPVASLDNIDKSQKILFTRIIQFKNTYFILTRIGTGESHIYGFSNKLYHIHSMYMPDSEDAHFFITKNKLYLIVVNNKERNLAETSIYLWTGVLFNEIQTVYTTGAIRITSFSTTKAEIIIILQSIPNGTVFTEVYEFSNKLRKIQFLSTDHPIHVDTYNVSSDTFVIIYEKSRINTVYQWNGFHLVKKFQFQSNEPVTNSAISNIGYSPVLMSTHLYKMDLLEVSQKYIKLVDEKVYTCNYSIIMDIHSCKNGKSITIIIVGMIDDYTVNIDVMNITIDIVRKDKSEDTEAVRKCFQNLESKMYSINRELNKTEAISVDFDDPNTILSQNLEKEPEVKMLVEDIQNRLDNNNGLLGNYTDDDENNLVINGKVIFNGTLKSDEATAKNVVIKQINSFKWTPKQFLKYKAPQRISGPSKIITINAKIFNIPTDDGIFKDLLLKNSSHIIPNAVEIRNLKANSMHAVQINDVKIDDIYSINKPQRIKGKKIFHKLNSLNTRIQFINQREPDAVITNFTNRSPSINFSTQVFIENLQVENISGQPWDDFVEAVYKISDNQINGSLKLSTLKTEHITMNTLRGIRVQDLMTTSTDQEIDSDIDFNRIYGEDLNTNIVNGINLRESAVTFDNPPTVKGAVTFEKLNVVKDLKLAGKFDESFFVKNGDHVLGTNESDLLQRYMRNVRIKGDLRLKNIVMQKSAKLFLSENEINPRIRNVYWTKYTNQNITVHPTFYQGLKTPHILANTLNGIDYYRYMLNNNNPKLETDFQFDRIKIFGKVTLASDRKHQPDLKKFMKEVVTTNGSFLIHGKKRYTNIMKPENLATTMLNGINALNVLNTKWPANVTGTKVFENLTIRGNLHTALADIGVINNVNVSEFLDKVVYIDEPQNLNLAHFKSVSATNLNVEKLNGHNYDDYDNSLEIMFSLDKVDDLYIDDDIVIDDMKDVSTINQIPLLDLYNNANKSKLGLIRTNVTFIGKVKVNNLKARSINDIDLKNITKRFLYRSYKNIIIAPYTFTNIKVGNIVTPKINNISMDVVDISDESPIDIMNDVVFLSPAVLTFLNVSKMIPCSIDGLWKAVKEPSSQMWSKLNVTGNVVILDENSLLHKIIHKSVQKNSDNIIKAPVKLANHMLARNVHTKTNLNNVNITAIFEDAVLTYSDTVQIITGVKSFPSITVGKAVVRENTNVPFVNDENVTALNEDIVDKDHFDGIVIEGKKTFFGGLQTDRLNCKVISNIKPENIVQTNSRKKVSFATFDFVEVEGDLNLQMINNHNLSHILPNRLLINDPNLQETNAVYYFENLDVQNMSTPSLNDYKMIDVVFDNYQNITGSKRFMQGIEIFGNLQTDVVNGFEIENEYKKSLPSDENVNINGSVTLLDPVQIYGHINAEYLNSYPISNIKEILTGHDEEVELVKLTAEYGIVDQLRRNVLIAEALPVKYIYLEKSDVLQISVTDTISVSTINSNGYVLIHLIGEDSGDYCGLPKTCKCPVQYTMEISPKHSVNTFINKGTQRVFSYDDDSMIIHFITSTVSTDSICRTNTTKEMSEMSVMNWNTRPSDNTTGSFHQYLQPITGYISKVDFFTLNGKTYVIIGKYYDPVLDSHDLDCIVLKFDESKTTATEIQRIRTKALWEIYLFYTAQGVVLVLGKRNNNNYDEEETEIYRFHEETEKFLYLRKVPFIGCTDATGVVLGVDSFIILAKKYSGIYILKYYPEFDNYYFYQSFDEFLGTVISVSSFYSADFGISDAFLCVVTTDDNFFVYSFKFSAGWKLESNGKLEELRDLIPFKLKGQGYLFAASGKTSSLLTVVTNEST